MNRSPLESSPVPPAAKQISAAVVVVEPGAGNEFGGHMREKLMVFTQRLKERGIPFHVFTWLTPLEKYASFTALATSPIPQRLIRFIPQRFKIKFLEFVTYRAAFSHAIRHGLPVMGLTISSPWGLVPARWWLQFKTPYIQRFLYIGLHPSGEKIEIRKRVMGAIQLALGSNGMAAFTTTFQNEKFIEHRPLHRNPPTRSYAIPEFILYDRETSSSKTREPILLIIGGDDPRRTPVQHLSECNLNRPFSKILLHEPSVKVRDEKKIEALQKSATGQVVWSNDYLLGPDLLGRFGCAKYCLVAYIPTFNATSSISLQSLACGLPVLISRFPDSIHLGKTFGKIGEFFDYANPDSLKAAIDRLLKWTDDDWNDFAEARAKVIDYCGYDRGVDYCLELMGCAVQGSSPSVRPR